MTVEGLTRERKAARTLIVAALAALTMGSCASVPRREAVPPPVPGRFSRTGADALPDRWWQSVGDSTLSRLIEQALSDNLTLKGAYARLAQADAAARRDGAARFPSVDIQGSVTLAARCMSHPAHSSSSPAHRFRLSHP